MKSGAYLTLNACFSSDQPLFKCSAAICGLWLLCGAVQFWCEDIVLKKIQPVITALKKIKQGDEKGTGQGGGLIYRPVRRQEDFPEEATLVLRFE